MAKITERIALQEFSYLEIEADSLEELLEVSEAAKQAYADKLHVAPESIKVHSEPEGKEYPTRLAKMAAEGFGAASKPVDTWTEEMNMNAPQCGTCQATMVYKSGITKTGENAGRPWKAYMCPNSTKENPHKPQWLR